ncbi:MULTISPECIES: hypothetical protein [Streptomyces]|uniref:Lipoprotein n=1 Tax=Streptomyces himastatinicus ATCC 53653 TaxID=457427 RepID=D9WDW0_9ACTN|nr:MULTISPECIES: hypothetical protein [Streptomyces]EFL21020.1 conserved hypothetical protein [Streptomyces himastatinicus ATCC 53653]
MSRVLRAAALGAALLCAGGLVSGCGGSSHADGKKKEKAHAAKELGKPGKPAALTQIADAIGCKATIVTEADELRQGACQSSKGDRYTMVTFATAKGQKDWLNTSKDYGGMYLVGTRWSVTGQSSGSLKPLRAKLGGAIEQGSMMHHGGSKSQGGSESGGGKEHDGMKMD